MMLRPLSFFRNCVMCNLWVILDFLMVKSQEKTPKISTQRVNSTHNQIRFIVIDHSSVFRSGEQTTYYWLFHFECVCFSHSECRTYEEEEWQLIVFTFASQIRLVSSFVDDERPRFEGHRSLLLGKQSSLTCNNCLSVTLKTQEKR